MQSLIWTQLGLMRVQLQNLNPNADPEAIYRVRQRSGLLKFFAVLSATVSNFNLKFYTVIN